MGAYPAPRVIDRSMYHLSMMAAPTSPTVLTSITTTTHPFRDAWLTAAHRRPKRYSPWPLPFVLAAARPSNGAARSMGEYATPIEPTGTSSAT